MIIIFILYNAWIKRTCLIVVICLDDPYICHGYHWVMCLGIAWGLLPLQSLSIPMQFLQQCDGFTIVLYFCNYLGCNICATLGDRTRGLGGILLYVHYTKTFSKDFPQHAKRNPPKELTNGGLHVISVWVVVLTVESGRVLRLYRKYLA